MMGRVFRTVHGTLFSRRSKKRPRMALESKIKEDLTNAGVSAGKCNGNAVAMAPSCKPVKIN